MTSNGSLIENTFSFSHSIKAPSIGNIPLIDAINFIPSTGVFVGATDFNIPIGPSAGCDIGPKPQFPHGHAPVNTIPIIRTPEAFQDDNNFQIQIRSAGPQNAGAPSTILFDDAEPFHDVDVKFGPSGTDYISGDSELTGNTVQFIIYKEPWDSAGATVAFVATEKTPTGADGPWDQKENLGYGGVAKTISDSVNNREFMRSMLLSLGKSMEVANLALTFVDVKIEVGPGPDFIDTPGFTARIYIEDYSTGGLMDKIKLAFDANLIPAVSVNPQIKGYWFGISTQDKTITGLRNRGPQSEDVIEFKSHFDGHINDTVVTP